MRRFLTLVLGLALFCLARSAFAAAGDQTGIFTNQYGPANELVVTIALPATYTTGGIPLTTSYTSPGGTVVTTTGSLPLDATAIYFADCEMVYTTTGGTPAYVARFDHTTNKIQLYGGSITTAGLPLVEAVSSTSLTGLTGPRCFFYGNFAQMPR